MKTAREFVDATNDLDDAQMVAAVEARDAEIRAEVLSLECSAHKKDKVKAADAADAIPDDTLYNDGLSFDEISANMQSIYRQHVRALGDAIPAAPTTEEICARCGVRRSYHGEGYSGGFTDERSCRKFIDAMDAQSIPDAPVIADGRQVGTLVTDQRVDLRESPPVPSRAEPVLSAREFALVAADILCDSATDETAIGSLTVEINRRDWAVTRDTERATQPPVPSRAELIELIRDAAIAATIADIEAGANWAAMALDALIKSGAVR